jgi:AcrR family transcriptional regulator
MWIEVSKREENRRRREQGILEAAERLFRSQGVGPTNMDQIAADAGVGVATVYNYFGRKSGILEAIVRPEMERMFAEAEAVLENPPNHLNTAVLELVERYTSLMNYWSDQRLLLALTSIGPSSDPWQSEAFDEGEKRVKDQIISLLMRFQMQGSIAQETSLNAAATAIFSVFNQYFKDFVAERVRAESSIIAGMQPALEIVVKGIEK